MEDSDTLFPFWEVWKPWQFHIAYNTKHITFIIYAHLLLYKEFQEKIKYYIFTLSSIVIST
jgi:hypothetical protein